MSIVQISEFTKKVILLIKKIPSGRVATYKQIAELADKPHASRGVSWILHTCSTRYQLPWHRVINSKGQISFKKGTYQYREQKKRLYMEDVHLTDDKNYDLKIYQWRRQNKAKKKLNMPQMF